MKDIFIIFGILLVLLILISTFGGSIKYGEQFVDDEETFAEQRQKKKEQFEEEEQFQGNDEEEFEEQEEKKEGFVEGFDGGAYAGIEDEA